MDIIKPTPSQAAVALKKFFANQGITIKLSLAQEAIAVTNGYPNWNVLAADIPTRAPKGVPADGAEVLGPEGLQLWAITCRVSGDDDDSLYLVWGESEGDATETARVRLKEDNGISLDLPDAGDDEDEDEDNCAPVIFNGVAEQVGVIVDGKFRLAKHLVPTEPKRQPEPSAPTTQVETAPQVEAEPVNEAGAGPTLRELTEMDEVLKRKGIDDEDDRLTIIYEVMETAARTSGLLANWTYQSGRGEKYMEDEGPYVQVSFDHNYGQRFATEIVLTLRNAKMAAYVRTWEFKNHRNYAIFDEQSGDFDTDAPLPEPTDAEPEPMFLALIRNALQEAAEHKRELKARINLD